MERMKALYEMGAISAAKRDESIANYEVIKSASSYSSSSPIKITVDPNTVEAAKRQVQAAEETLKKAKEGTAASDIVSSYAGTITRLFVMPGDHVQTGEVLLQVRLAENPWIETEIIGEEIEIMDVIQKEKITKPDLPFDLTTLQRECNKYFGYSAKQTLDYAQSLYEKKLITYPRTDSRCLTEDMITGMINNILGKNDFDTQRIKVIFNSSKVTDHHAIIPTLSSLSEDLSSIPESEAKVYRLISNKFHASVGYSLIENTTKIVAESDVFEFTSTGKVMKEEGFTKYLKEYKSKKNEDTLLPDVNVGDVLEVKDKEIKEKYTKPPKHFTEDTLLKAMEITGNDSLDKNVEVERKGLGTPATRAGIIENLIYKGFIERDKKNLIATNKGISVVTIVSDTFKSAETTAEWEMKLSDIANGKANKDDFLKCIENEIRETVGIYRK